MGTLALFKRVADSGGGSFPLGWSDVANSALISYAPANGFGGDNFQFTSRIGGEGGSGGILAYSGGVFDTLRNRLIIWGGGHDDYYGNEIYALDLDTLVTSRIKDPTIPTNWDNRATQQPEALGSDPNSRHTYTAIAYMTNEDKMFSMYGALASQAGGSSSATWLHSFAPGTWQNMSPSGTAPTPQQGQPATYDSSRGLIFAHDPFDLYSYTPGTNTYAKLTSNGTGDGAPHSSMAVDPVNHILVYVGGGFGWWYDVSVGSSYVRHDLDMTGATALRDSGWPGLVYDSSRARITGWLGGNTIYDLNTISLTWSSQSFSGGPADPGANGAFGRFQYSPTSNVFVTCHNVNLNMSVLRVI